MFENKVVVVTGGAKGIGKAIAGEFHKAGAQVCIIDLLPNDYYVGDLADQTVLENFAAKVICDYGHVDYLINNALPLCNRLFYSTILGNIPRIFSIGLFSHIGVYQMGDDRTFAVPMPRWR